jgi:hemolysin III
VAEATLDKLVKPRLRGVFHQWAFFVALIAGAVLVVAAPTGRATFATLVYAAGLTALFGVSAVYHRVNWTSPGARRWMRRLDHSMIFFMIAGTYTPFALLVLEGSLATAILIAVWGGALAGVILNLAWVEAPKWVTAVVYLTLGWVAVVAFPDLISELGWVAALLLGAGGLLYSLGAIVYALKRPDPVPSVFGYHEVFHVLVIAAAALQYAVVAFYVLPEAS